MNFVLLIVLAGIGTYLIRLLPMLAGQKLARSSGWLTLFLSALGLSAIAALIVVSVTDLWLNQPEPTTFASLAVGTASLLLTLRATRNVGVATLCGALVYGLVTVALQG
ncbi:MAG: AzlD domain-containing protein [Natronospirillum sp.]